MLEYATKAYGFIRLLHTKIPFVWDQQAQESFDALKQALASAPLLSAPDFTRDFILYVSASDNAIVGILVQEDDACHENVIYYISQKLTGPPLRYSPEEKLPLAVVFSAQKLCHYIIANHTGVVVDSNPMWYLLIRCLLQGQAAKWVVVLQEFNLEFVSPTIIKALTLTMLMTDLPPLTVSSPPKDDLPDDFIFVISTNDPWYGDILLYLRT